MKRFSVSTLSLVTALAASLMLLPAAQAQNQEIETAALRCSAISIVHSPLTVPSPAFGELMTQFAGLFAQIHMAHKSQQAKAKITPAELAAQRDAIITEMGKGWPGVKNDRIKEAAICNVWRTSLFAKLPEKPTEKDFQAALLNIGPPPTNVSKDEIDSWAKLTPQAFAMWAQIKSNQKAKK